MRAAERQRTKEKHEVARALLYLQEIPEQDHVAVLKRETNLDFFVRGKLEKSRPAPCVEPSVTTEQVQV